MGVNTQHLGQFGEEYTVKYLKKQGYKILERNFHSRYGEIDIIALDLKKKIIVFVEVKTRTAKSLYTPREAVDFFKQQKCIKTAQYYLMQNRSEFQPRFDVSEIIIKSTENQKEEVESHNYIENAF